MKIIDSYSTYRIRTLTKVCKIMYIALLYERFKEVNYAIPYDKEFEKSHEVYLKF